MWLQRRAPHRHDRRASNRRRAAVTLIVLSVLVAGCNDDADDSASDDPTSTTVTSNGTTSTIPVEQEVEEAYLAYWAMLDRLAQNPDPEDPEITRRATGEALEELTDGLVAMREAGWRSEFGDQHTHDVVSVMVDGMEAVVEHCAVDDSRVVDTTTEDDVGEAGDIVTVLYEATLIRADRRWQVRSVSEKDTWQGAGDCS